jgi:murein DD-endopeptidase MepM/ murein hydrolase activator NlpD
MAVEVTYFEPFDPKLRGDELGNLAPYRNGRPHRGQDWHPKEKSPIKAICDGTVGLVEWTDVLGHILVHSSADGKHWVLYAHLAVAPTLKKGDKVVGGQTVVGLVGGGKNTPSGSASTGAHLHMTVATMGKNFAGVEAHLLPFERLVDPLKLFTAAPKKTVAAKVVSAVKKVVPTKKA